MKSTLEQIIEKVNVLELLEELGFDDGRVNGKLFRSACKIHDGNNPTSFVCNLDTGLYFCHTGGCKGDIFTLVQEMKGYSFPQAKEWIQNKYNLDFSSIDFSKREEELRKDFKEFIKYVSSRKKKETNFSFDVELKNIDKLRKYNADTLNYFKVKYSPAHNSIYFPIFFDGKLVGAQLRTLEKARMPKWLILPTNSNFGSYLFNYDNVKIEKEIIVVEGLFDVLAFHQIGIPAVATFGAHMTNEQANLLLKTFADVTLCYDEDNAGYNATIKAIEKLKFKTRIKQIKLDDGQDPDNTSSEVLKQRYNNRVTLF